MYSIGLMLVLLLTGCGDPPSVPEPDSPLQAAADTEVGGATRGRRARIQQRRRSTAGAGAGERRAQQRPQGARRAEPGGEADLIAQLEAIGYMDGVESFTGVTNVTIHEQDQAWQGLNLYTSSGIPEAVLMDMNGQELHRWRAPLDQVFPDRPVSEEEGNSGWRRATLLENGHLLVIFPGFGIARIDKNSRIVWATFDRAHHDMHLTDDGKIYTLTRTAHMVPRIDKDRPILEDYVDVLDTDGNTLRSVSVLEAFEKYAGYEAIWEARTKKIDDIYHTNGIWLLDDAAEARNPAFKAGRVLLSMRHLEAIAVMDLELGEVVWAATGSFKRQHDPRILDNGHLMLFDNQGDDAHSNVIVFDPKDMSEVWRYPDRAKSDFQSRTCGLAQPLPNGNTLILESNAGRAFEITPEKDIVWEYMNPHTAPKPKEDGDLVATLFEFQRLPLDTDLNWLPARFEDVCFSGVRAGSPRRRTDTICFEVAWERPARP